MSDTTHLVLPLHAPGQAQRHETHNRALATLDALVQLSVKDRGLSSPPASPASGDRYIIAAGASGAWTGHALDIAAWDGSAWLFHEPREGWRAWIEDENAFLVFDGAAWIDIGTAISVLQNLALLGVGATADATNPFSAKLNRALWAAKTTAEGGDGDLRSTMSKEAAGDTLSLLFQTGFSGRAEIGLIGDEDLAFKVSPNGSAWAEGMRIDKDDGSVILDAAGALPNFLIGTATPRTNVANAAGTAQTPGFQKVATSGPAASFAFIMDNSAATGAAKIQLCKGGASAAAVGSGDRMGEYNFNASDGINYLCGAVIRGVCDGVAIATGTVSGRLEFHTNAGAASPSERLRIDKDGNLMMGGANTVISANRHFRRRQYAAGLLPSQASGDEIGSSDIVAAPLVSDGTQWISPGVKLLNAVTANSTLAIPAGWAIERIHFANTTANAVTGGIRVGTTSGAADVVAAQAIGANALDTISDANVLKKVFSRSASQTLFIQAVTAWNGASLELSFMLRKVF